MRPKSCSQNPWTQWTDWRKKRGLSSHATTVTAALVKFEQRAVLVYNARKVSCCRQREIR